MITTKPLTKIAKEERDDNARPESAADLTKEQLAEYDTVFLRLPGMVV